MMGEFVVVMASEDAVAVLLADHSHIHNTYSPQVYK